MGFIGNVNASVVLVKQQLRCIFVVFMSLFVLYWYFVSVFAFVFWFVGNINASDRVGFRNVDSFSRLTSGETTRLR